MTWEDLMAMGRRQRAMDRRSRTSHRRIHCTVNPTVRDLIAYVLTRPHPRIPPVLPRA